MPGTHFSSDEPEDQIAAVAEQSVDDLARRLASRTFHPLAAPGDGDEHTTERASSLAYLHTLVYLQKAVERLSDLAAEEAVRAGAGYPQLGRACHITRQAARRRWPGLVTAAHPARSATHTDRSR
ncbi:hypothetical protein [Peterkaempfera griseoplana]|uniref:hypothetical protein n=1 Tax=Peterkaempfera griseoplana TaxID=66896 RepID=UPI0006E2F327|nr:hypothetical protein [Peterkaempfera griseoplana]